MESGKKNLLNDRPRRRGRSSVEKTRTVSQTRGEGPIAESLGNKNMSFRVGERAKAEGNVGGQ